MKLADRIEKKEHALTAVRASLKLALQFGKWIILLAHLLGHSR